MKKVIESRGENNNCNDEFSQWCCKHLATLNKNTIDSECLFNIIKMLLAILFTFNYSFLVPTFVTFLKDVESEYEVKDYIQNYLGDNKEVREFIKQFFDKRLKIQNKQRSTDFVEMKVSKLLYIYILSSVYSAITKYKMYLNKHRCVHVYFFICFNNTNIIVLVLIYDLNFFGQLPGT